MAMRRSIGVGTSALALLAALAIGPLGATAAPPYVYGCTPAALPFTATNANYTVTLHIYNGSATTASLTHKVLAGNGTILNAGGTSISPVAVTSTLAATQSESFLWASIIGNPAPSNGTIPAAVRIVSNVPVSATLGFDPAAGDGWILNGCTPQQP